MWRQQLTQLNYSQYANCIVANWGVEHDYAHIFPLYSALPSFNHDQLCLPFSFGTCKHNLALDAKWVMKTATKIWCPINYTEAYHIRF